MVGFLILLVALLSFLLALFGVSAPFDLVIFGFVFLTLFFMFYSWPSVKLPVRK